MRAAAAWVKCHMRALNKPAGLKPRNDLVFIDAVKDWEFEVEIAASKMPIAKTGDRLEWPIQYPDQWQAVSWSKDGSTPDYATPKWKRERELKRAKAKF
jgi:hypothetical protein